MNASLTFRNKDQFEMQVHFHMSTLHASFREKFRTKHHSWGVGVGGGVGQKSMAQEVDLGRCFGKWLH